MLIMSALILSLALKSPTLMPLSAEDALHPYEVIRPYEMKSLFEMMESEIQEEEIQEQQEDPLMRKFEDKKKVQ